MTVSESISNFLENQRNQDLVFRYHADMEVQVNVDQSLGEPTFDGLEAKNTWTRCDDECGTFEFHHIRIPKNAGSEPERNDWDLKFPLHVVVESIGMTGWNFAKRKSVWVAFDFDSIVNHSGGIDHAEIDRVRQKAMEIPWIEVRRSTSGAGLHLYAFFDPDNLPDTQNHGEHAVLARAVLGLMSREAGYDFSSAIDCCGGNMWVWSKRSTAENQGLEVIAKHTDYAPIPSDSRDMVPEGRTSLKYEASDFTDDHKLMEERIHELGYTIVWVPEHKCWNTHTKAFQDLQEQHEYLGQFETVSDGNNKGNPNCFAVPRRDGSVKVVRFSKGQAEAKSWKQDGIEWTWCLFNSLLTFEDVCETHGFATLSKGVYATSDINGVKAICEALKIAANVDRFEGRQFNVANGRIEVEATSNDALPDGWLRKRGKAIFPFDELPNRSPDAATVLAEYEHLRCVVDPGDRNGNWYQLIDGKWVSISSSDAKVLAGEYYSVLLQHPFQQVIRPFEPEYPSPRVWNKNSPKLAYQSNDTPCEHWMKVVDHCGRYLTPFLNQNPWFARNGITTGADYLAYWIAVAFRKPEWRLPILVFFGEQNSGKSIFWESLQILFPGGVVNAGNSLISSSGFNGELVNQVFGYVDEMDLSGKPYTRLKDWSTAPTIPYHGKNKTPFPGPNNLHFIHCCNDLTETPSIKHDDSRCTFVEVKPPAQEIPKTLLTDLLRGEAPGFLHYLLGLNLPAPRDHDGRFAVPQIRTPLWSKRAGVDHDWFDAFSHEHLKLSPTGSLKRKDLTSFARDWGKQHGCNVDGDAIARKVAGLPDVKSDRKIDGDYGYLGISLINS